MVPHEATLGDFADHVTTAFTDVRLKRFLEMRGADAGTPAMMLAQSALWVGLLYDDAALAAAEALVRGAPAGGSPRCARGAPDRDGDALGRAAPCATWRATCWRSRATGCGPGRGSRRRADEAGYLDPLTRSRGRADPGGALAAPVRDAWHGDVTSIFDEAAI